MDLTAQQRIDLFSISHSFSPCTSLIDGEVRSRAASAVSGSIAAITAATAVLNQDAHTFNAHTSRIALVLIIATQALPTVEDAACNCH